MLIVVLHYQYPMLSYQLSIVDMVWCIDRCVVCAERARCGCHTGFLARTVDGQVINYSYEVFDLSVVTPNKSSVSRSASSHQPPSTTVNRYLLTNTNERRYRGVEDEDDEQRGVLLAACSCSLLEQRASESYHPFERYRYRTQCNGNGGRQDISVSDHSS